MESTHRTHCHFCCGASQIYQDAWKFSPDSIHEYTIKTSSAFKETVIFGLMNWQELLDICVNHFSMILP